MSAWSDIINYINNNDLFLIIDLRAQLYCGNTEKTYICYLMNAGYIERTGRGIYKKLKKIPESYTVAYIRKLAYDELFKQQKIRQDKIKNINASVAQG